MVSNARYFSEIFNLYIYRAALKIYEINKGLGSTFNQIYNALPRRLLKSPSFLILDN